jgi:Domain of unknown function (DUF5916)/Carbohydrate family 9 binding domain-like
MKIKYVALGVSILLSMRCAFSQNVETFLPPATAPVIKATQTSEKITIDGNLSEAAWGNAPLINEFLTVEPQQNKMPFFKTEVRLLYDDKNLYVGAYCFDTLGKSGVRVAEILRDFDWGKNELFGVVFDPDNTKRLATTFQTTPYGNQRDMQVFDDEFYNINYDALWDVRTQITAKGWYAEFKIPFKTLRYSLPINGAAASWTISFVRRARRANEISAFPVYPRAFSPYRTSYAAQLTDIQPPKPSSNVIVRPYILYQANRKLGENFEQKPKIGAEVKWAITPHSVLDFTANTDFAQADADRQVINLKRFSVFFPERRQFFLENSGTFNIGEDGVIQPFFSRRVGLDDNGNPLPIDAGLRYTDRTDKHNIGALLVRQRTNSLTDNRAANIGVLRYQRNFGSLSGMGGMLTQKYVASADNQSVVSSTTFSTDVFYRPTQTVTMTLMLSGSSNEANGKRENGLGGKFFIGKTTDKFYLGSVHYLVSERYNPALGFVSRNDQMVHYPVFYRVFRPSGKWKKWILRNDPGMHAEVYHGVKNWDFQEAYLRFYPAWILFQSGARFHLNVEPIWQNLPVDFSPAGTTIRKGRYQYTRLNMSYNSDLSKKISAEVEFNTGGYFDGSLTSTSVSVNFIPIPNLSFSMDYGYNYFVNVGDKQGAMKTHLITPNLRLALNPRVQLSAFYQYNSLAELSRWNVRGSWEFRPQSFLYVVFNDFRNHQTPILGEQQFINKLSYVRQF